MAVSKSLASRVRFGPVLAEETSLEDQNAKAVAAGNLAPQLKVENEKETPITVNYDELVKSWQKN